jgi:DNA-directed RNA polymerase subunit RPC12/RpoP
MSKKIYVCVTCGGQAHKEPVVALKNWKTAQPSEFSGLGKWHCPKCGKCKVKVCNG